MISGNNIIKNSHNLKQVISGGQTGADLGGLLAAEWIGIPTGGMAAAGYKTERGKQPLLGTRFKLEQHSSSQYPPRTEHNVQHSCVTIVFASNLASAGTKATVNFTVKHNKEYLLVDVNTPDVDAIVAFLKKTNPSVVNIAGNRESVSAGITKQTRKVLYKALSKFLV